VLVDTAIAQFVPAETEVLTELHQYVAAETLTEVAIDQFIPAEALIEVFLRQLIFHRTRLEVGFKLIVETKADILISQYSRFISFPFDNYVLTDLSQYAPASNLIDIECNQIDISDNL